MKVDLQQILERAEQQVARAREDLDLARRRKEALVQFGRPLELSQARSDAQSSRESLRQLETKARDRAERYRHRARTKLQLPVVGRQRNGR